MSANYIYFDVTAINEMIKIKELQNIEYKQGEQFLNIIESKFENFPYKLNNLIFQQFDGGIFCTTNESLGNKGVVFDLDYLKEFQKLESRKLNVIFKVIRFCIKYWNRHPYTRSEMRIANSNRYCILPLTFSVTNYYKIFLDSMPDGKRQEKRDKCVLLAYQDGYGQNPDANSCNTRNFKKFLAKISTVIIENKKVKIEEHQKFNYSTYNFKSEKIINSINNYIGFENWIKYLTKSQEDFIFKIDDGPARIEGPAGSGKTLSLILRCINIVKTKKNKDENFDIIFLTHSSSTKDTIMSIFQSEFGDEYFDRYQSSTSITVTTLLEWCIENASLSGINLDDCLEPDALDTKEMQKLYIEEALDNVMQNDFASYEDHISKEFKSFVVDSDSNEICELLQNEIAIFIKGQSEQNYKKYLEIEKSALPIHNGKDKAFVFTIFEQYSQRLLDLNLYDVDDIILTALGTLNTPIWKRVRNVKGYDLIVLDETQLFNFNELAVLKFINKEKNQSNITFSQDISQSVGDTGYNSETFDSLVFADNIKSTEFNLNTVFRSTPEIAELAFSILSSGQNLLTMKDNPLDNAEVIYGEENSYPPKYYEVIDDRRMVAHAFSTADDFCRTNKIHRSEVLFVCINQEIVKLAKKHVSNKNKPCCFLKKRGDGHMLLEAKKAGKFVCSHLDFVGGLEFTFVIILGVDKNRIPQRSDVSVRSVHFNEYAAINKLYVAVTRARNYLNLYGLKTHGESPLIKNAIDQEILCRESV